MALWILRLYSNCLGQANWGFLHSNYLKENHLTGIKGKKKPNTVKVVMFALLLLSLFFPESYLFVKFKTCEFSMKHY